MRSIPNFTIAFDPVFCWIKLRKGVFGLVYDPCIWTNVFYHYLLWLFDRIFGAVTKPISDLTFDFPAQPKQKNVCAGVIANVGTLCLARIEEVEIMLFVFTAFECVLMQSPFCFCFSMWNYATPYFYPFFPFFEVLTHVLFFPVCIE